MVLLNSGEVRPLCWKFLFPIFPTEFDISGPFIKVASKPALI